MDRCSLLSDINIFRTIVLLDYVLVHLRQEFPLVVEIINYIKYVPYEDQISFKRGSQLNHSSALEQIRFSAT